LNTVPEIRIRKANEAPVNPKGAFVLYWMIANRRTRWNFSLDRAVQWANELKKPLIILEALRMGYPWASDRLHAFIVQGMTDNARRVKKRGALYYPYVESKPDQGKGLLHALSKKACVVVTDDYPAFFIPRMVQAAARKITVSMEQVDSNGLLPMRAADRVYPTAYAFRRFLQKTLPNHLFERPHADPLNSLKSKQSASVPKQIIRQWPMASSGVLKTDLARLASLSIDHSVATVEERGGAEQASALLSDFIHGHLSSYPEERNHPDEEATSGLSPYLHFGFISVHQVFDELMQSEDWFFDRLAHKATGKRAGWWGMSEAAEAFLDELVTWRELGFNMCWQRDDYDRYESLPDWARKTLGEHELDQRSYLYTLEAFENAETHDALWNAAQRQLVREGRIHNYLRMLWGKKILEWSPTPREAAAVMIELNNKYALDGRDPNSYSGIFWILGRYDRAWGPERPIFGKIRYMSSKNTARKVRLRDYLTKYAS
jgi:deoxyribodipyrimidine photo-lyase